MMLRIPDFCMSLAMRLRDAFTPCSRSSSAIRGLERQPGTVAALALGMNPPDMTH
ncbi:hypothetical protein [Spirosoma flavus]